MSAVLQYLNQSGKVSKRIWEDQNSGQFYALVKYYFRENDGKETIQYKEKPSTRPTNLEECKAIARKLISQYGSDLTQIIIWNIDEIKANYSDWLH